MFKIPGSRQGYYQWDINQRIIVEDRNCNEVHFYNCQCEAPLTCEVRDEDGVWCAPVPNILLQTSLPLTALAYVRGADGAYTKTSLLIKVRSRPKPDDYVYTETEVKTWESAVEYALQLAQESGAFTGKPGDDGVSPAVTVEETETGHEVTITDASGAKSFNVKDGKPGVDGLTPHIGANGNWWIGDTDTGTKAQGEPGKDAVLNDLELIASGETTEEVNRILVTQDNNGNSFSLRDMVTIYIECPVAAQTTLLHLAANEVLVGSLTNGVSTNGKTYCRVMCVYSGKKWDAYGQVATNESAVATINSRNTHNIQQDSRLTSIKLLLATAGHLLPVGLKYEIYGRRA